MHKFMKAAGIKSEKEFYDKYPTQDAFFAAHPHMAEGGYVGNGVLPQIMPGMYPGNPPVLMNQQAKQPMDIHVPAYAHGGFYQRPGYYYNGDKMVKAKGSGSYQDGVYFEQGGYPHPLNKPFDNFERGGYPHPLDIPFDEFKKGGKWIQKAINPAHKGYMQKGGKVNTPIYVDSPNDPRYKAYQDSLNLYNKGEITAQETSKNGVLSLNDISDKVKGIYDNVSYNKYLDNWGGHKGDFSQYNKGNEQRMYPESVDIYSKPGLDFSKDFAARYAKPQQPVVYKAPLLSPNNPNTQRGNHGELIRVPQKPIKKLPTNQPNQLPIDTQQQSLQPLEQDAFTLGERSWSGPITDYEGQGFRPAGFYKQEGGEVKNPMDWLSEYIEQPNLQKKQRAYHGRKTTKINRSTYLPHPSINKFLQGGENNWLNNF